MIKFLNSTSGTLAAAALAATISAGGAHASVAFATFDCDSDTMADFIGGGCGQAPNTMYTVDVLYDGGAGGTAGTGYTFEIVKTNQTEIKRDPATWDFVFSGDATGSVLWKSNSLIRVLYTPVADLVAGLSVGSLKFTTGEPLVNDAKADIIMREGRINVNPEIGDPSEFEVQMIPLPASALLLAAGFAGLAGLRRRG